MMEELYTYLQNCELQIHFETCTLDGEDPNFHMNFDHKREVDCSLKRMREVYFKKDWTINHPSNGPLPVYIV